VSRAPDVVAFRDLDADRDHDLELLERFHREVLAVSFSVDELDEAAAMQRQLRGETQVRLLASVAVGPGNRVLGGVVGEVYAEEGVLLLAYLAVRPELRGRGVGAALVEHAGQRWFDDPTVQLALGEVHDPRVWAEQPDEHPGRRLDFYSRFDARVLGVPFVQPALKAGRSRIRGFLLLAFHIDPSVEVQSEGEVAIRSEIVGRFVRRYYELSEGAEAPYDAELARMLALIDEHPAIPLLPIVEFERVPLLADGEQSAS
jgi:GNAT superfamily N-acetyltransferase